MFDLNLKDYLKENKAKEALDLFKNTNDDIIRNSSCPTIQIVSSYITDENAEHNREMFDCCKMMLYDIAEKCEPSETWLPFLEEMENDIRFCTILEVISKNVLKVNDKLKVWCINTIKSYIEELSAIWEETKEVTTVTNRILKVYNSIILFLEIIVQEAALQNSKSESYAELRDQLLSVLICLMGEPLCYLPDHILESRSDQPLPEKIVILMNHITGDLLQFLNIMSVRSKKHYSKKKTMDEENYNIKKILFESDENVSDLAYGFRSIWTCRVLLAEQTDNTTTNAQHSSQDHNKESDEDYEKNIKSKILDASLKFVHDLGWSQQAISAGAESIGYPGVIHGLFPNHGADLVQYFYLTCNNQLNKMLKEQALAIQENSTKEKKALESQVQDAVQTRLRMVIPYKKTWPQALALMTLPPNVPMSLANLLTLVDDICYYAGDRSVDINWYTRRIVLAGIYKTTELYMLQDSSEDHKQTWNFLDRRIKEATQIHSILTTTSDMALPEQALNRATEAASAAFITARNILGLNWNR